MTQCPHFVSGDPARPCGYRAGHRDNHRDEASLENRRQSDNRRSLDRDRRNRKQASERQHASRLRSHYGLEPDEYALIKQRQGGKCAICARATGYARRLSVDHCHKTREIRGLLCHPCNSFLGRVRDNPEAGRRLAEYLANPPARHALGRVALVPEDSPAQQPRKRKPRAPPKTQ